MFFNSNDNFKEITIALAGVCQAIDCVQSIARNGQANKDDMQTLFGASLKLEAESTEAIFGDVDNLNTGFKSIVAQLSGSKTEPDFGRYLINVITLEKQLAGKPQLLELIASRISQANRLVDYKDSDEEINFSTIEQLAGIYKDSISTLPTKIQVTGSSKFLEQSNNQHLIRALLLGAIRSAVLWRQIGGKKRHFIFNKSQLIKAAKDFLK